MKHRKKGFISFFILFTIFGSHIIICSASSFNNDLDSDFDISLGIETFTTEGRVMGIFNITMMSNTSNNFTIFLPTSQGEPLIQVNPQNYSENVDTKKFELSYEKTSFFGECYSIGAAFPIDSYWLIFIVAFSEPYDLHIDNDDFFVSFYDRFYYADWEISYSVESKNYDEVLALSDYLALDDSELKNEIDEKEWDLFYVLKSSIYRRGYNYLMSYFFWMPTFLVGLILWSFSGKEGFELQMAIRLYPSIAFFSATYFLALINVVPPPSRFYN